MPENTDKEFSARLLILLEDTHTQLTHARKSYGESWIKRGGMGAFMNLSRKWDRVEEACARAGWDVMKALEMDRRPEGLIDDLRDLRDYCLLIDEFWTRDGDIKQYVKEVETPASKVAGDEIEILMSTEDSRVCQRCFHIAQNHIGGVGKCVGCLDSCSVFIESVSLRDDDPVHPQSQTIEVEVIKTGDKVQVILPVSPTTRHIELTQQITEDGV